jgi:hypothetical protein
LLEEIAGGVVFDPSLKTRPRRAGKPMPLTNGSIVVVALGRRGAFSEGTAYSAAEKLSVIYSCKEIPY